MAKLTQWLRGQARVRVGVAALVGLSIIGLVACDVWQSMRFRQPESEQIVPTEQSLCEAAQLLADDWAQSLRDDPRYSNVTATIMEETVSESAEPANPYHGRVLILGRWTCAGQRQQLSQYVRYKWSADRQRWCIDMMPEILDAQASR